jgi:hypothetical protein
MKRTLAAAVLAACVAVAIAGCGTLNTETPKQALTAAHQAHDGLAKELDLAASNGWIKGEAATMAARYLAESETDLTKADDALAAGQSIAGLLALANADIAKVQPLIPEKP